MKKDVFDPITQETYRLDHLRPLHLSYTIKVKGQDVEVPLVVFFSDHCYTESRKDQPESAVILREQKRGGIIDERVFWPPRWKFSKSLPDIIEGLHNKRCHLGDNEIFYRQEGAPPHNSHAGWYICIKLGASEKHQNLWMSVRSVHWRENRPYGVTRGNPRPFYAVLSNFYEKQLEERDWLE
ncbi:MAG: hypothetical protein RPU34_11300 [Candidatus Sedimenticola sp. (ex Thyasira tokunagai)]